MRVAMIGPFGLRPKGTMAVRALPLAKALVRRGHEVALYLPPWSYPEDAGQSWTEDGVRIENVPVGPRVLIGPRLVARALAWHSEVVVLYKPKAYAGLAAWQLWQMRRIGAHRARLALDTDDWEGAGGWNEIERYSTLQKLFFARQEQWGLAHCDALTVASRALQTIVWSRGVSPDKVYYLPNGVSPANPITPAEREAARAELGFGPEPIVLWYTRFFEVELSRLVEIFRQISASLPQARLLVVGKGLFGEEGQLLARATEMGWADRLSMAGWVEPSRLRSYFAGADAAVYPFEDTLLNRCKCPVKLTDLLAAGVPVVAEKVGQISEYIVPGETGIVAEPRSTQVFACETVKLLQDSGLRTRLGLQSAARMAREFSWDRLASVAEEAYGATRR